MNSLKILQWTKGSFALARTHLLSSRPTKASVFKLFFATFFFQEYYKSFIQPTIAYTKTEKNSKEEEEAVKSQAKLKPNEIIELSKQDYYDKIMGNDKDFFFLIIYEDKGEESKSEINQVSTFLKSILDENNYAGFNVFLINRQTYNTARDLIARSTETNLSDSKTPLPIEIYLKTPHSYDFMYLKYKQSHFLTQKSQRKYKKVISKVKNLIEVVDSEAALMDYMFKGSQKFGQVTVLRCLDMASGKDETSEYLKTYAKLAFSSLESKYLSRKSNFILIRDPKLMAKYNLQKDFLYVLNHDLIHAFENRYGELIENDPQSQPILTNHALMNQLSLIKVYQPLFKPGKKKTLSEEEKAEKWNQELRTFFNAVTPRMFLIKDTKYSPLGQLFKKSLQKKSNYTLSLYCSKFDPNREQKVKAFMELYKKHKSSFNFVIIETEKAEDIFPHATSEYPELALFNFFHLKKTYQDYEGYYKSPIYPYKKHFLRSNRTSDLQLEEIEENIEKFFRGELKDSYLTKQEGRIQTLKGRELSDLIQYSKTVNKPLLLGVCEPSESRVQLLAILREIAIETTEKNLPLGLKKGIVFGKSDELNLTRFFGDSKGEKIIYFNPATDCLYQALFPNGFTDEEAKRWIYNLLETVNEVSGMNAH